MDKTILTKFFQSLLTVYIALFSHVNSFADTKCINITIRNPFFLTQEKIAKETISRIREEHNNELIGAFGPDSIIWEVFSERSTALALPRMGILQLSHPEIAQYIIQHSSFKTDTLDRLNATAKFLLGFVYGDLKTVERLSNALISIHRNALSKLDITEDKLSELYIWVHLTTWDSIILGFETTVRRLTVSEKDQLYKELKKFAGLLGISELQLPSTYEDFQDYIKAKISNLELTPEAMEYLNTLMNNNEAWNRVLPFSSSLISSAGRDIMFKLAYSLLPENIRNHFYQPGVLEHRLIKGSLLILKGLVKVVPKNLRFSWTYLQAVSRLEHPNIETITEPTNITGKRKCPFSFLFEK